MSDGKVTLTLAPVWLRVLARILGNVPAEDDDHRAANVIRAKVVKAMAPRAWEDEVRRLVVFREQDDETTPLVFGLPSAELMTSDTVRLDPDFTGLFERLTFSRLDCTDLSVTGVVAQLAARQTGFVTRPYMTRAIEGPNGAREVVDLCQAIRRQESLPVAFVPDVCLPVVMQLLQQALGEVCGYLVVRTPDGADIVQQEPTP